LRRWIRIIASPGRNATAQLAALKLKALFTVPQPRESGGVEGVQVVVHTLPYVATTGDGGGEGVAGEGGRDEWWGGDGGGNRWRRVSAACLTGFEVIPAEKVQMDRRSFLKKVVAAPAVVVAAKAVARDEFVTPEPDSTTAAPVNMPVCSCRIFRNVSIHSHLLEQRHG